MAVVKEFYKMWLLAPKIHGYNSASREKITLSSSPKDQEIATYWSGDTFVEGSGTKKDPLRVPVADSSPHLGVFELWFLYKRSVASGEELFIRVRDLIFSLSEEGVTAEDGSFTRLLPYAKKSI